jgi:hypothetical protein
MGGSTEMKLKKTIILTLACASLTSCADPAFQNYIQSRERAIAAMPNGPSKYHAEEQLALMVYQEKRRQEAQAQEAAMGIAAGMAAGAAAAQEANRHYYYPQPVIIYNGY